MVLVVRGPSTVPLLERGTPPAPSEAWRGATVGVVRLALTTFVAVRVHSSYASAAWPAHKARATTASAAVWKPERISLLGKREEVTRFLSKRKMRAHWKGAHEGVGGCRSLEKRSEAGDVLERRSK